MASARVICHRQIPVIRRSPPITNRGAREIGSEGCLRQHVPHELAARATLAARDDAADAVLTVGGGSTTGLGKGIAVETGLPLIAVATTYAGSEINLQSHLTRREAHRQGTYARFPRSRSTIPTSS